MCRWAASSTSAEARRSTPSMRDADPPSHSSSARTAKCALGMREMDVATPLNGGTLRLGRRRSEQSLVAIGVGVAARELVAEATTGARRAGDETNTQSYRTAV